MAVLYDTKVPEESPKKIKESAQLQNFNLEKRSFQLQLTDILQVATSLKTNEINHLLTSRSSLNSAINRLYTPLFIINYLYISLKMTQEYNFDDENLSQDCPNHWSLVHQATTRDISEPSITYSGTTGTSNRGSYSMMISNNPDIIHASSRVSSKRLSTLSRHGQICYLLCLALLSIAIETSSAFQFQPLSISNIGLRKTTLFAKTSSPSRSVSVQQVQPLQSSTQEKRLSVERAWEQARSLAMDESEEESISATPYLDLFTDAGFANVKPIPKEKQTHSRPKGRPESVPGAMSRTTMMNLNEIEARAFQRANENSSIEMPPTPKKRGRGRPRKNATDSTSVDEITSIAATAAMNSDDPEIEIGADGLPVEDEDLQTKQRKSRIKNIPKARKYKESEKEGETTGMMPFGKRGRNGELEPPNLQRYYRTHLLTQEEEYTLGMKIQFLMKCEGVHEGLFLLLGRAPSLSEWSVACGFTDEDPIRSKPDYQDTEFEMQIRPVNSEAWDDDTDPNMFVGNGLANDSGPGRGRGRAKKTPATSLKDYYDDSDTKFTENPAKKSEQTPINRGSPLDFIELMLTGKEAKQKMVQCNMRLVVSISKRYKHVGVNIADLVQEGSIGLTRAAEKFDPKKGFKFSTYASW